MFVGALSTDSGEQDRRHEVTVRVGAMMFQGYAGLDHPWLRRSIRSLRHHPKGRDLFLREAVLYEGLGPKLSPRTMHHLLSRDNIKVREASLERRIGWWST